MALSAIWHSVLTTNCLGLPSWRIPLNRRTFLRSASIVGASTIVSQRLFSLAQETSANGLDINISTESQARALPHAWEECVGSDRAIVATRAQWLADLKLVKETTGIKSVRFHGLFNDEMGVWPITHGPRWRVHYRQRFPNGWRCNGSLLVR